MKNKGFSLVELLAVIILLGILAVMLIPNMYTHLQDSKEDLYNTQVNIIKEAAENYVADNIEDIICSSDGENTEILLSNLQSGGYLKEDLKNPKTNENFSSDQKVIVTCTEKTNEQTGDINYIYKYQFIE